MAQSVVEAMPLVRLMNIFTGTVSTHGSRF
jgi:hypothetical protein